jgi:DNA-binding NtrC family response regulator
MGGVSLYQELIKRWPDIKMLFITGHPEKEGDRKLLESGNINWLQKPFSVEVFNQAVYNLLHQQV